MKDNILAAKSPRKSRATGNKNFSRARKRLRELERIIAGRHVRVPDTDDADLYLDLVANCFCMIAFDRGRPHDIEKLLRFWCEIWAVHLDDREIVRIAQEALASPAKLIPDDVAGRVVRLSYAERQLRKATTIGSFDADRAERKRRTKASRQKRDRAQKLEKRRAAGAMPRAVYEGQSLSRTEPWKSEGISRRTWERRRKKMAVDASPSPHQSGIDASVSPHLLSIEGRRTCVTSVPAADSGGQRRAHQAPERKALPVPDNEIIADGGVAQAPPLGPLQRAIARAYRLQQMGAP